MRPRLLLPLAVVALTLAWATSASAFSISFIEPISPTDNISATTDLGHATVTTSPELASISAFIPTLSGVSLAPLAFALREGPVDSAPISDLVTISITNGSVTASFQSDTETGLSGPTPVLNATEATFPQLFTLTLLAADFSEIATFAITVQSDLDLAPVPEPSTLLLFGFSMAALGAVWRRSRRN
jgi:PEP-CTERM motif-containing protein